MITATQSFKLYELLQKHFKNDADAKSMMTEIETVIENRFLAERDRLATKEDLLVVKEDLKGSIASLETRMERGFKEQLKWLIILMFGFSLLIVTIIKFL